MATQDACMTSFRYPSIRALVLWHSLRCRCGR